MRSTRKVREWNYLPKIPQALPDPGGIPIPDAWRKN